MEVFGYKAIHPHYQMKEQTIFGGPLTKKEALLLLLLRVGEEEEGWAFVILRTIKMMMRRMKHG